MPFIYPDGDKNASYVQTNASFRGNAIYRVTKPFSYVWNRKPITIAIPVDYLSDLATIPKLPFLPRAGGTLWDDAAIIHDKACNDAKRKLITYRDADGIFYDAMIERGCSKFTATVFWAAVSFLHCTIGKG